MGRIKARQVRVFAMFSAAMFMMALAYAFSARGDAGVALAASAATFACTCAILLEARES